MFVKVLFYKNVFFFFNNNDDHYGDGDYDGDGDYIVDKKSDDNDKKKKLFQNCAIVPTSKESFRRKSRVGD